MQFRAHRSRDQEFLLPPSVDEWITRGHMAPIIDEAVEAAVHVSGAGAPAYHPQMLLKLITYEYLMQRFSSRRISEACREDLAMRWQARLTQPKHSTIAEFSSASCGRFPGVDGASLASLQKRLQSNMWNSWVGVVTGCGQSLFEQTLTKDPAPIMFLVTCL